MTLTFRIRNFDRLDNGMPTEFVLNRRGAMIGRSPTCDWSLPDGRNYISSRHCEVGYADGHYLVTDVSTNGTFLNGATDRMAEPRRVAPGDMFLIGQYEVVAELSGDAVAAIEREQEAAANAGPVGGWAGWDSHGGAAPPAAPPPDSGGWGATPAPSPGGGGWGAPPPPAAGSGSGWGAPPAAPSGGGAGWAPQTGPSLARPAAHRAHEQGAAPAIPPAPVSGGWSPAQSAPVAPVQSAWEAQMPAADPASSWSSAVPDRAPPPSPDDIWGKISEGNVVDWARGGFGQPVDAPADPLGLNKPQAREALPVAQPQMTKFDDGWGASPAVAAPAPSANQAWGAATPERTTAPAARKAAAPPPAPPAPAPTAVPGVSAAQAIEAFIAGAGITRDQLKDMSPDTLTRAGGLFRKLIAGLVVMVEARARAKSQMGAEATSLEFDGNNPIKFARTPEQAIAQLLNPPERGFMEAGRAVEDSFYDLQSHQMATLKAMQGALKATLDRFSPTAIKARAENKGLMAKIMPGARDAALWAAYEREFGGVAQGSDEAFMDVFAKEFRKAYEEQARKRR